MSLRVYTFRKPVIHMNVEFVTTGSFPKQILVMSNLNVTVVIIHCIGIIIGFIFGRMAKSQAASHMRITGLSEEKPRQL